MPEEISPNIHITENSPSSSAPRTPENAQRALNVDGNKTPEQILADIAGIKLEDRPKQPIPEKKSENNYTSIVIPEIHEDELPKPTEAQIEEWARSSERLRAFIRKRKPGLILLSGGSSHLTADSLNMQNNLIEGIQTVIINGSENGDFYKSRSHKMIPYDNPTFIGRILRKVLRAERKETEEERKARVILEKRIPSGINHIMFLDDASQSGEKMRAVERRLKKFGISKIDLGVLASSSEDNVKNLFIGSRDQSFFSMLYDLSQRTSKHTDPYSGKMDNPYRGSIQNFLDETFARVSRKKQELRNQKVSPINNLK